MGGSWRITPASLRRALDAGWDVDEILDISTAPPDRTLAALRTAGYAPILEAGTGTTVLLRGPAERAPSLVPALNQVHPHRASQWVDCHPPLDSWPHNSTEGADPAVGTG
ncbi:hypothetical protein QZH56_05860 [Streptomyces olivoreticuli]|uniref:hypothetical protein n=1 Tax=Streptomyces olivoreticuli TaxID=68246 RepID=UPI00265A21FD|nr:hypothetical protein [Streptomyces olivoreticuli]WKK25140.1 hypothetical protein QZH56_05860 [Streptomyces olivoreticuli]